VSRKPTDPGDELDPAAHVKAWIGLVERLQRATMGAVGDDGQPNSFTVPDPSVIFGAFARWGGFVAEEPDKLFAAQMKLWQDSFTLWQHGWNRMLGQEAAPLFQPERADRRFKDETWDESPAFDLIKQSYLMYARWLHETVDELGGPDAHTHHMVRFYTQEFIDALSPTNFAATNPAVLKATADSKGKNLLKGLEHLVEDVERGHGQLAIRMTDENAFEVGENVAVTPGKIVYQNRLMQLIQYAPSTDTVYRRPLLIVPPWINKYYILDLGPRNSAIKWLVDQGLTLFVVSWINPDENYAETRFEDYMLSGALEAMCQIEKETGEDTVNIVGYCIGGTLTAALLAYLAAKGQSPVTSATFLTSMLDFEEPGDLGVFIDQEQLDLIESHMDERGFLEGRHMSRVFNLLRANDLIWSFVVNNYLLGREPFPFDLLYWNADSTRMPAEMHKFYLRTMYQHNLLREPGAIELDGIPIDLGLVTVPSYFLSTREDHIAPWKSTYRGTQLLGGSCRFVLAASGHIAGVINPPVANKYCYWTRQGCPADPDRWLANATETAGSWWPHWARWLARHSGGKVPARQPGAGGLTPLEDAPGSYVKVRLAD